jgi:uncharacterized protein (DUF924 family)
MQLNARAAIGCRVLLGNIGRMETPDTIRAFFYLPLEHSESLDDQQRAVALFGALADNAAPAHRAVFDDHLDYALRHRDIIARFGRFPHRNSILGRPSSNAELTFLRGKGSSF